MSDRGRSSGTGGDSSPRTSDTGSYRHAGYRRKHNRDRDKTPMPQSGAGPHRSPQTPRRSPQTKYDRMSPYPPRSRAGTQRREFLRERSPERRPKTEAHQADEGPQASSSSNPIGRPVIPSESSRAPPPSLRAQQVPPQMGRQLSADSEISIDTDVGEGHTPPITERCLQKNHHCMAEIRSLDQGNGVVHCLTDDSGVDSWEIARNKYTHRSELVTFGTEDPRISESYQWPIAHILIYSRYVRSLPTHNTASGWRILHANGIFDRQDLFHIYQRGMDGAFPIATLY